MKKPALRVVSPTTEIRKVTPRRPKNAELRTREYLTEKEIEQLIEGCQDNRRPHRDQTMILLAYRHGLRASEVCDLQWTQVDFQSGTLAVTRAKNGTPSTHPLTGRETQGAPEATSRGRRQIAVHVRQRAWVADDGVEFSEAGHEGLRRRGAQDQGPPAYAEACLRLQARERGPRYARPAGVLGAQEYPAYGSLRRTGADPI